MFKSFNLKVIWWNLRIICRCFGLALALSSWSHQEYQIYCNCCTKYRSLKRSSPTFKFLRTKDADLIRPHHFHSALPVLDWILAHSLIVGLVMNNSPQIGEGRDGHSSSMLCAYCNAIEAYVSLRFLSRFLRISYDLLAMCHCRPVADCSPSRGNLPAGLILMVPAAKGSGFDNLHRQEMHWIPQSACTDTWKGSLSVST